MRRRLLLFLVLGGALWLAAAGAVWAQSGGTSIGATGPPVLCKSLCAGGGGTPTPTSAGGGGGRRTLAAPSGTTGTPPPQVAPGATGATGPFPCRVTTGATGVSGATGFIVCRENHGIPGGGNVPSGNGGGMLPFTGFGLLVLAALAAGLIASGLETKRRAGAGG
jgi:hypothetical protein